MSVFERVGRRGVPVLGAVSLLRALSAPWPHYAELVPEDHVGVRIAFPPGRNNTTPCDIVAQWAGPETLEAACGYSSRGLRQRGAQEPEQRPALGLEQAEMAIS